MHNLALIIVRFCLLPTFLLSIVFASNTPALAMKCHAVKTSSFFLTKDVERSPTASRVCIHMKVDALNLGVLTIYSSDPRVEIETVGYFKYKSLDDMKLGNGATVYVNRTLDRRGVSVVVSELVPIWQTRYFNYEFSIKAKAGAELRVWFHQVDAWENALLSAYPVILQQFLFAVAEEGLGELGILPEGETLDSLTGSGFGGMPMILAAVGGNFMWNYYSTRDFLAAGQDTAVGAFISALAQRTGYNSLGAVANVIYNFAVTMHRGIQWNVDAIKN